MADAVCSTTCRGRRGRRGAPGLPWPSGGGVHCRRDFSRRRRQGPGPWPGREAPIRDSFFCTTSPSPLWTPRGPHAGADLVRRAAQAVSRWAPSVTAGRDREEGDGSRSFPYSLPSVLLEGGPSRQDASSSSMSRVGAITMRYEQTMRPLSSSTASRRRRTSSVGPPAAAGQEQDRKPSFSPHDTFSIVLSQVRSIIGLRRTGGGPDGEALPQMSISRVQAIRLLCLI